MHEQNWDISKELEIVKCSKNSNGMIFEIKNLVEELQ